MRKFNHNEIFNITLNVVYISGYSYVVYLTIVSAVNYFG